MDYRAARRRWGEKIAKAYVSRINLIYASDSVNDLRQMPHLHLHSLEGDRKGEFAVNLEKRRWRLIFSLEDQERTAVIVEVSNHYDD